MSSTKTCIPGDLKTNFNHNDKYNFEKSDKSMIPKPVMNDVK